MIVGAKIKILRGPGHLRAPSGSRVAFGKPKVAKSLEGTPLWDSILETCGVFFAFCLRHFWSCLSRRAFGRRLGQKGAKMELSRGSDVRSVH